MNDKEKKWREECSAVGLTWIERAGGGYSKCSCNVCGHVDNYVQSVIRLGNVKCSHCYETKMSEECKAIGFTWLVKVDGARSRCECIVCGHIDNYVQSAIRLGKVKCSHCYETKMSEECSAVGLIWLGKVDKSHSKCSCIVCGHVDNYVQNNVRRGKVKCTSCQITKYQQSAKQGWTFRDHFRENKQTYVNLKHSCSDDLVKVGVGHYLNGVYDCPHCQITKYQQSAKQGWTFIDHFRENKQTYVNLKHSCSDTVVKVQSGTYLNGSYDCPHCMHTHFSDPSYFYVIQVDSIIKLGISNRPNQRYTQYGLPDDASIIEHLRIPLETKRDALVVESYAKQLVKDFKIHSDAAKQVFTKGGFNECYTIDSLGHLLEI